MNEEEKYEKLAREAVMEWMKCATGACDHWDREDAPCGKDRATKGKKNDSNADLLNEVFSSEPKLKRFDVYLDGSAEHIYAEDVFYDEDDDICILRFFIGDRVVAVFREWDYFKVADETPC